MSVLPWTEKYRPDSLDDIIDHKTRVITLKKMIRTGNLTHLLLYGPPSVGKTSMVMALANDFYGKDNVHLYVKELNASGDRGIDVVRGVIANFCRTMSDRIKLVVLDEADAMTADAQYALRRVIEDNDNCRFVLICNNITKIIQGLQSRCLQIKFGRLNKDSIFEKLREIASKENISIDDDAILALTDTHDDFRQILHTMHCISGFFENKHISKEDMITFLGRPNDSDLEEIVEGLFNQPFHKARDYLINIYREARWDITTIIKYIFNNIQYLDLDDDIKLKLYVKFSDIEYRINSGCESEIQLTALVAYIKKLVDN